MIEINLLRKKCSKCKILYGFEAFGLQKNSRRFSIRSACKACVSKEYYRNIEKVKRYHIDNRPRIIERQHKYRLKNRDKFNNRKKKHDNDVRNGVFSILGHVCVHCGEDDIYSLEVDHIHNDGAYLRHTFKETLKTIYKKLLDGCKNYQTLCVTCNHIKSKNKGILPPERKEYLKQK